MERENDKDKNQYAIGKLEAMPASEDNQIYINNNNDNNNHNRSWNNSVKAPALTSCCSRAYAGKERYSAEWGGGKIVLTHCSSLSLSTCM